MPGERGQPQLGDPGRPGHATPAGWSVKPLTHRAFRSRHTHTASLGRHGHGTGDRRRHGHVRTVGPRRSGEPFHPGALPTNEGPPTPGTLTGHRPSTVRHPHQTPAQHRHTPTPDTRPAPSDTHTVRHPTPPGTRQGHVPGTPAPSINPAHLGPGRRQQEHVPVDPVHPARQPEDDARTEVQYPLGDLRSRRP